MTAAASKTHASTPSRPERRGVSRRRVIGEAKEKVPVIDLAERLCGSGGLRKAGKERVGRCPLPDHEDRTPSFAVNPEKGVWFCHGCVRGGDVVELARLAWGYERYEVEMAAANLLHEFGYERPSRPANWFRKAERQRPIRAAIEEARVHRQQQRVYKIFVPLVRKVLDEDEQRKEARYYWDVAGEIAGLIVAARTA